MSKFETKYPHVYLKMKSKLKSTASEVGPGRKSMYVLCIRFIRSILNYILVFKRILLYKMFNSFQRLVPAIAAFTFDAYYGIHTGANACS